jgi:nitrilase
MVSGPDVAANLATARRLLEQAAAQGARLAALPEYFCLIGQHDRDKLAIAERLGEGPMQAMLASAARELGLYVVGGTLPLKAETPDRVRNSTLVFDPQGQRIARYDKIHLFAFDNGRESYDEGRVLEAGSEPASFEVDGLRVGLSVCYDLRFPELFRRYAPVDLLLVPAAFTHTTGQAHWELLLRARAVENQCYVLAPAQGGTHPNGRRTFGHTELIDPWGQVLAVQAEGEGVVIGEVDPARIAQVREQLPALKHRKL